MTTVKIFDVRLNTFVEIKEFVGLATMFANRLELHSDRWVVDAKSIMGIFSLDLTKPIELCAEIEYGTEVTRLEETFKKFRC